MLGDGKRQDNRSIDVSFFPALLRHLCATVAAELLSFFLLRNAAGDL